MTRREPPAAGPPAAPADRGAHAAAALLIAAAFGTLAWYALTRHPVGDYFTESDFYDYAAGALRMRQGVVDPARYGVIGPVYEVLLALGSLFTRDLFRYATLLSAFSAAVVMACGYLVTAHRARPLAGLFVIVWLATQPVLFRYGYSACTDVPAVALQSLAMLWLLTPRRGGPFVAGVFAALGILTRYTGLYLVPAAALFLLARRAPRGREAALWAGGLLLVIAPWTAFSAAHGHLPAEGLVRNAAFFTTDQAARNAQDRLADESPPNAAGTSNEPAILRVGHRALEHARRDSAELLGMPLAMLLLAGLLLVLTRRADRAAPVALHAATGFGLLLASFYSDRYSLMVLPAYLMLAALSLGWLASAWPRARIGAIVAVAGALGIAWSEGRRSASLQAYVRSQLPVETRAAAGWLRAHARGPLAVLARKAAVPWYAGAAHVAFPRVTSFAELAGAARAGHATHLWFSWYEGELRPEFWCLLDSTAAVPGLRLVHRSPGNPGDLYAIEPAFGAPPAWWADSTLRRVHTLRGYVRVLGDTAAVPYHRALGIDAANRFEGAVARDHFAALARIEPANSEGWTLGGYTWIAEDRPGEAERWFARALALEPADTLAQAGEGLALWRLGRREEAERRLRAHLGAVRNRLVLAELQAWYAARGDDAGAAACGRRLVELFSTWR